MTSLDLSTTRECRVSNNRFIDLIVISHNLIENKCHVVDWILMTSSIKWRRKAPPVVAEIRIYCNEMCTQLVGCG